MAEPGETLSERELDVLQCVSRGASNKEIASELSISQNTVKAHLRNIYTKLEVSSRTEATTAAIQQGYIVVPNVDGAEAQAETEKISVDDADSVEGIRSASAPGEEAPSRSWRTLLLLSLLLISVIVIAFLGRTVLNQSQATVTPEPFAETAIADSRWLISRPMPEARSNLAVAAVGLDIYQIGGETVQGIDGKVTVFDSVNRVWRDAAPKPTPVADATAVELFGELYVPGGRLENGQATAVVEAYSPTQDAWRPIASLPQPLAGGLTISDGAFLYVFGGWDGENYLDTAFKYDPSADSWRPLPAMPQARAFTTGGELTGNLAVVGGENEQGESAKCLFFDPVAEEWSSCPDMLQPRTAAGAAVLLNKLYVIGGSVNNGDEPAFSEVYDPESETWQIVNTPNLEDRDSWSHAGVGHVETRIYVLGGRDGENFLDETLVYAPLVYQTFIPSASSGNE